MSGIKPILIGSLVILAWCAVMGPEFIRTGPQMPPLAADAKIQVFLTNLPSNDYTLLGIVSVEHENLTERIELAINEARKNGGDAIIAQEKGGIPAEDVAEVQAAEKMLETGSVKQDFLVVKLGKGPKKDTRYIAQDERRDRPREYRPFNQTGEKTAYRKRSKVSEIVKRDEKTEVEKRDEKKSADTERYQDNGDGTVTGAGMTWEKCSRGQKLEEGVCSGKALSSVADSAKSYCESLNLAGKKWRLPTKEELITVAFGPKKAARILSGKRAPVRRLYNRFFPKTKNDIYWSSSSYREIPGIVWVIDFSSGLSYAYGSSNKGYVRCVASP